jgi:diguanylate cyclase (GGDEF)-like protein/PAS domain S-box-containing protein
MDSPFFKEFSSVYLSGAGPLAIYLADSAGSTTALAPLQGQQDQDIENSVRALISAAGGAHEKELARGGFLFTMAAIGDTGWSVVSIRHSDSVLANFSGKFLQLSLLLLVLSAGLLALFYSYIKTVVKPVNEFISHLGQRFETDGIDQLDGITAQIEAICSNMNLAESIPIGVMVVDLDGVIKFFNREAGEITGHSPSAVIGRPMLKYFPNNYHNYTMECMLTGREYLGLRNIIKSGSFFKELLLNISPLYCQDTMTGAVATFQDVTPQRKMIEVHAAYTLARDLASQKDLDSTVKIIARAAAEMVDIEYTAIFLADQEGHLVITSWHGIPDSCVEKYNHAPYALDNPEIKELYRNKAPLLHGDIRNKQNLKTMLVLPGMLSFYSFPVIYEGNVIGMLNLYSPDKNKLSKDKIYLIQTLSGQVNTAITNFYEFQKMRLLASIDGLTGLLNKKYFLETLSEEIKRASAKAPLSLSMMDLDHFKNVNDTYGHQAGDHVLKEIADIMTRSLRESDSICRFGGEEIAVLMPGTSKSLAIEIIEALRIKISNTPVCQTDDGPLFITVSGGVATYPGDGETLEELLQNSDTALYKSKRNGRNMISGFAS